MRRHSKRRPLGPSPSVPDPRRHLLQAVLAFVRAASSCPGVLRIALVGSLATDKAIPKDADVLVSIDASMDLDQLARIGRRLKGAGQTINLGGDVFLADETGRYIGRIAIIASAIREYFVGHSTAAGDNTSMTIFRS